MKKFLSMLVAVLFLTGLPVRGEANVLLILDASGSMWERLESGEFRIVAAKRVLGELADQWPLDEMKIGLRVFGTQQDAGEEGACQDSRLLLPLGPIDRGRLKATIRGISPRGAAPLAFSLRQAVKDFPREAENKMILLVTDGEEGCRGDLSALAAELRSKHADIEIRIIGFDLPPQSAELFEGAGIAVDNAASAGALAAALTEDTKRVLNEPLN